MDNNIQISVIIPVYNAEDYLEDCLNGVRSQTFNDYEVWVVDDGSTDGSARICDRYAEMDPRFHVVHTQNQGVSMARNTGLDHAQGEWICFVDSDDTVNENYLSDLYKAVACNKQDVLIVQGFNMLAWNQAPASRMFEDCLYEKKDLYLVFKDLNLNRSGHPFAKLYNRQIIQKERIRFIKEIHYAEDVMFMLTYMCHISAIRTVCGANYNYCMRNGNSLGNRISSFESEYLCYETYLELIRRIKEKFFIRDEDLVHVYGVISEYLMRRALGGLYQWSTRHPFAKRMELLKSLTDEQIAFANKYYKECALFHKVSLFLLTHRFYYLCDRFNCLVALGRTMKKYKIWH